MPHSLVRQFLAAILAAGICSVPTDSLAQASPYPVSRARPFRVIPAGTLLEIDRALSKDPVKQVARVSLWPDDAFLVVGELDTKLLGRYSRAVILREGTEGVRIMEREKEIVKMTILHFEPAIENAMMGGTWKLQPIHRGDYSPPRPNPIELPQPAIPSQPAPKKR